MVGIPHGCGCGFYSSNSTPSLGVALRDNPPPGPTKKQTGANTLQKDVTHHYTKAWKWFVPMVSLSTCVSESLSFFTNQSRFQVVVRLSGSEGFAWGDMKG